MPREGVSWEPAFVITTHKSSNQSALALSLAGTMLLLKLGEIDVNYSRLLISVAGTKKNLDAAEGFAKEHKYYECNLALKAAEDSVVLDSVSLLEFPKAGATVTRTDATATKTESKPEKKTQK